MAGSRLAVATVLALVICVTPAAAMAEEQVSIAAPDGNTLLVTGVTVRPGDRFIDPANDIWQVFRVDGGKAGARRIATLARTGAGERSQARRWSFQRATLGGQETPTDVVIYHTHSDESYRPTDGVDSSPDKGGVYRVGAALAAALGRQGLRVVQRPENHNPHDYSVYMRSRRTVLDSLDRYGPGALFDVHRDAAPASQYRFTAGGVPLSRVMIVIGRSNPTYEGNLAVARLIKERADELHPGLVRGIYLGQGNYNQDVHTRNLLLEAGSQEVPRPEAEAGIALLADAIVPVLRELADANTDGARTERSAIWRNIGWLLAALLLLALGALALRRRA